jgi:aspartate/methionine/tyrosine aminotransferase
MVWEGRHHSPLEQPGMIEQTLAVYTFSKSYRMSGWRIGYAIGPPP